VDDSAHFFITDLTLAAWLRASYERVDAVPGFDVWVKRGDAQ
jgi:hypothetical protein